MSDVFQERFGDLLAEHLRVAQFSPVPPEHELAKTYSHEFSDGVLISFVEPNATTRELMVQYYLRFFEELIDKLLVQAMQIRQNLQVDEDFTVRILDMVRMFTDKITRGDPLYLPYLMDFAPLLPGELEKGIQITLRMLLYRGDVPNPTVLWDVSTEYWEADKHEPAMMNKILDLECSSDLRKLP